MTIKKVVETLDEVSAQLEDAQGLYELAREESDPDSIRDAAQGLDETDKLVAKLEFRRMLSGEYDDSPAILSINAGAGGVDSQDWAEMLLRMYLRWGERNGFKVSVVDVQEGEPAGIRSAEILISGDFAYGQMRSEKGVHRLVRISPFDSQKRRQTSFASVMVLPEVAESDEVEINPAELREDTYRSSGAGGQHVNKTDSAVRITHLPTGIAVACQMERSQHKNRATAMRMLKAKLFEVELQKRADQEAQIQGEKKSIEWGSQIRSYVLQPYQQVNDHRTELKSAHVMNVLDGDLEAFIESFLLSSGNVKEAQ